MNDSEIKERSMKATLQREDLDNYTPKAAYRDGYEEALFDLQSNPPKNIIGKNQNSETIYKMNAQELLAMEIHESKVVGTLDNNGYTGTEFMITRVFNGWLYTRWNCNGPIQPTVFVPIVEETWNR